MNKAPYINLHTHHATQSEGIYVLNKRFGVDDTTELSSFFSVGIHPWDASKVTSIAGLEKLVLHPDCLAVGECGLDKLKGPNPAIQRTIFEEQLQLALKHHKPVIIHCVKAFDELMQICAPYTEKLNLIIHGFNKSAGMAQQLIAKGFYLSVGMQLLKKEDFDISVIPIKKLFLETDIQEMVSIDEVYKEMALKQNMDIAVLKEKIYSNFAEIRLPKTNTAI